MTTSADELEGMTQSDALVYRRKGDECRRLAGLCYRDGDLVGYGIWRDRGIKWYAKANALAYDFPDLDPDLV